MDAGSQDNRSALGVFLVVVNLALFLAAILTSWFAVQKAVDETRDGDNAFRVAKVMLRAERTAFQNIRSTRELDVRPTSSSAQSLAGHEVPPFPPPRIRRHVGSSRRNERGGAGGESTSDDAVLPGRGASPLPAVMM